MDKALKQRLVGASVLIALAVVILPMFLGGRPDGDGQESQKIELPPQPPDLDFETRRYPVGEQPQERTPPSEPVTVKALPTPALAAEPATDAAQEATEDATEEDLLPGAGSDEAGVEQATEEPASEPVTGDGADVVVIVPLASPVEETQEAGRYVVQVASFGALENANRLAGALRGYGYAVMLDSIKSDTGTLHRVRVGPYADETEASGVVSRLRSQVRDVSPRVVDLLPDKAAQVTRPSDPLARWVVQVGSFSDAANADKLVARLRLESLSAYKEQLGRSGSVIYRVRVGPFLQREDAVKADQRINERLSIDGVVIETE